MIPTSATDITAQCPKAWCRLCDDAGCPSNEPVSCGVWYTRNEEEVALDDLVIRARQGDTNAFDELAMRHITDLYRMATAMVGHADAADLTQEAMLAAWRELPRLRDPAKFGIWVRRILMNRCRNALRTRSRHPTSELSSEMPVTRHEIGDAERRVGIEDALATLTDLQRAVVVLHYLADLPLAAVAEILTIPEGTAKSRLHQALVALRAHFGTDL
jgi:RNA polymerase sigma-70 factor, ECF subfamily